MTSDASKTVATKRGHKTMSAHVRGWNKGIRVDVSTVNGILFFEVFETNGSTDPGAKKLVFETQCEA